MKTGLPKNSLRPPEPASNPASPKAGVRSVAVAAIANQKPADDVYQVNVAGRVFDVHADTLECIPYFAAAMAMNPTQRRFNCLDRHAKTFAEIVYFAANKPKFPSGLPAMFPHLKAEANAFGYDALLSELQTIHTLREVKRATYTAKAYTDLALALLAAGRVAEADRKIHKAKSLDATPALYMTWHEERKRVASDDATRAAEAYDLFKGCQDANSAEARQHLDEALALSAPDKKAFYLAEMSRVDLQAGHGDKAIASLRAILRNEPGHRHARSWLGVALTRAEQHEQAVAEFAQIAGPLDEQPAEAFADSLEALGRHGEATVPLQHLADNASDTRKWHARLASCQLRTQDYRAVLATFAHATSRWSPDTWQGHFQHRNRSESDTQRADRQHWFTLHETAGKAHLADENFEEAFVKAAAARRLGASHAVDMLHLVTYSKRLNAQEAAHQMDYYAEKYYLAGGPIEQAKFSAFMGEFYDRHNVRGRWSNSASTWESAAARAPLNAEYQHQYAKVANSGANLRYFLAALQIEPGNQQFWRDYIAACGQQNELPQFDLIRDDAQALKRYAAYPECTPRIEARFLARVLEIEPNNEDVRRRFNEVYSFWHKIF